MSFAIIVSQDKLSHQNEECCSYTSSNRESWGRCSSIGASDDESSAACTTAISNHQVSLSLSRVHIPAFSESTQAGSQLVIVVLFISLPSLMLASLKCLYVVVAVRSMNGVVNLRFRVDKGRMCPII